MQQSIGADGPLAILATRSAIQAAPVLSTPVLNIEQSDGTTSGTTQQSAGADGPLTTPFSVFVPILAGQQMCTNIPY
jgi:hypothetical protein